MTASLFVPMLRLNEFVQVQADVVAEPALNRTFDFRNRDLTGRRDAAGVQMTSAHLNKCPLLYARRQEPVPKGFLSFLMLQRLLNATSANTCAA